ncbi:enoyl-CoA hydratase/isomerase family protein [Chelativorans sp. AA-79]|uniref:enoyl-CoA hydratase/isomerase family protein n=1 Tax=Chelativorans sp. AA-79 TaxID=3028735 RepID=UPI0023F9E34A|nr:enoyl-CoA hydratase/isomerase family protein [Chelativorans sp. AA-79]WEX12454.1 enoyl-CoA hydratase/isomerase family protein [Chelativorans sp. AA-79]
MDYSSYEHLIVAIDNGVATVTINRPEVYNAVNHRLHIELGDIWRDLDRDKDVGAIVVTGAGDKAFSAGGDLSMLEHRMSLPAEERFKEAISWEPRDLVYNMVNCDKIIIAAINGTAVGAGLAVALMSDISVVSETAKLGDGHIRLGVVAGDHAPMIWPLLCGMAKSKYYLLTGDFIDGKEAERIGLVSMAVPQKDVLPKALELAERFATGPQFALGMTKRSLNQWLRLGGLASFDYSLALEKMAFFSGDAQAGVRGVREKKKAVYPSAPGKSKA